jgi:hypothetical protein
MESRTGAVPARSSVVSSRSCDAVGRGLEPHGGRVATRRFQITDPLRPATKQAHQDSNPDQRGWSSLCCQLHQGPARSHFHDEPCAAGPRWTARCRVLSRVRIDGYARSLRPCIALVHRAPATKAHRESGSSGRPESNGLLRAGDPMLRRLSYVRVKRPAGLEPASSAVAGQRSIPRAAGARKEPPAGVEPAPRPYKGRVLAVDTTEA